MNNNFVIKKRQICKKRTADKINNALAGMSDAKKTKVENTLDKKDGDKFPDENGIVTWKVIAKSLKCTSCRSLLDLEKLYEFKTEGLHSKFKIKCDKCAKLNKVNNTQSEKQYSL